MICSDKKLFGPICCFSLNSIHYSSCFSNFWSNGETSAWNLVSKWYSEDGVSEVRVSTSFSIFYNEKCFGYIFCYPLNTINYSSWFSKPWSDGEILDWSLVSSWSSEDGCSEVRVRNHFNVFWWEHIWFHVFFSLLLYQFFFLFFETLVRWRKLGLESDKKVIFRGWSFKGEIKQFVYNDFW